LYRSLQNLILIVTICGTEKIPCVNRLQPINQNKSIIFNCMKYCLVLSTVSVHASKNSHSRNSSVC